VPSGARRFAITRATIGADGVTLTGVQDLFAAGLFQALSDEQKLSLPSFEPMTSGAVVGEHEVTHGPPVGVDLDYEQRIVTASGIPEPAAGTVPLPAQVLDVLVGRSVARPATFAMRGIR
jgi:hypothetical protein